MIKAFLLIIMTVVIMLLFSVIGNYLGIDPVSLMATLGVVYGLSNTYDEVFSK